MSQCLRSCALAIMCILFAGVTVNSEETSQPNSDGLIAAWEAYLNYPSPENALVVYHLVPDSEPQGFFTPDSEGYSGFDLLYDNVGMIEIQICYGDSAATLLALRLFRLSSGDYTEWLCKIIGKLIRLNPRLFLQCLKTETPEDHFFSCILDALGDEFVDRETAARYEIELRTKALESVTDPELVQIRDSCISIINGD